MSLQNKFNLTRNLGTRVAGFLGSHLIDKIMSLGEEVICIDNYFTGNKTNIKRWIGHPNFELIRHDVTKIFLIKLSSSLIIIR